MLKWIRDVRLDFKTGVVVIILALVFWGIVTLGACPRLRARGVQGVRAGDAGPGALA